MQVKVTNNYRDSNMTGLQGYVLTTYDKLVEVFGKPMGPGDKTTAEWILKFSDGTVATIYDWKEYATPQGEYSWHVGGNKRTAAAKVQDALDGYIEVVSTFDEDVEYYGA